MQAPSGHRNRSSRNESPMGFMGVIASRKSTERWHASRHQIVVGRMASRGVARISRVGVDLSAWRESRHRQEQRRRQRRDNDMAVQSCSLGLPQR